jgi:tellurite resistance protein TehA-like permease
MTPVWIFPAYPVLLAGPLAAQISKKIVNPDSAITIIFGGFILQGIGFMVSVMIYSAYMYRLMTQKLPTESLRPGMFISIGPSGFTVSALIGMSQQLPQLVGTDFMGPGMGDLAAKVSIIVANWTSLWLWG